MILPLHIFLDLIGYVQKLNSHHILGKLDGASLKQQAADILALPHLHIQSAVQPCNRHIYVTLIDLPPPILTRSLYGVTAVVYLMEYTLRILSRHN
ncbi:MAG: hypothetical protein HOL70_03990 [Candidatus Marinimicrobia bacterium]|nr:hypothetical protein [Candidatus Neomarinimicrobiota bacterium]